MNPRLKQVNPVHFENQKINRFSKSLLEKSAQLWFMVAVIGQWIFVYYILAVYGGAAFTGDLKAWNIVMPHGFVPGQTMGNIAVGVHLLLAAVISFGGPLQLIEKVRTFAPAFHRWNGRIYILTAFIISISGLYMVWTRGTVGGLIGHISISINALLIMLFAIVALRYIWTGNIKKHRRWALRLFLVVSGVWFFRVGLMFWIFINDGPVGFDPKTFQGPFLTFLNFAQFLLPLLVLEIYLFAKDRAGSSGKFATAATLFILTVAMGIGIFVATMGMWLPRI